MTYRIFIFLLILFAIDLYVFQGVKVLIQSRSAVTQRTIQIIYWAVAALCFVIIISGNLFDWHQWPKALRTYSFALIVIIYFSKLFAVIFLLFDDVLRL